MAARRKTLVLNFSIWRSGGYGSNQTGIGQTNLRNDKGFECCLGQFCKQLNPELKNSDLSNRGTPQDIGVYIPALTLKRDCFDSALSDKAVMINDDSDLTFDQRIEKLKKLFKGRGLNIKVINRPKTKR